jgi:hypothetical protein
MEAFVTAYRITGGIGEAQALRALDDLAKQMGGTGLEYWARRWRRFS